MQAQIRISYIQPIRNRIAPHALYESGLILFQPPLRAQFDDCET